MMYKGCLVAMTDGDGAAAQPQRTEPDGKSPKEEIKADVQYDSDNAWNWNSNSNNNNWNNSNNVLVLSDLYKRRFLRLRKTEI